MRQWYERDPERWALERRLLRQTYPGVKLVKKEGVMHVLIALGGNQAHYYCELIYPKQFPFEPMDVFIRNPVVKSQFHQFRDGQPCLLHSDDIGVNTTAVVYISWLREWLKRFEESLVTGMWRD